MILVIITLGFAEFVDPSMNMLDFLLNKIKESIRGMVRYSYFRYMMNRLTRLAWTTEGGSY